MHPADVSLTSTSVEVALDLESGTCSVELMLKASWLVSFAEQFISSVWLDE